MHKTKFQNKPRFIFNLVPLLTAILFLVLLIFLLIGSVALIKEIEKKGLKPLLTEVWEGPEETSE